MELYSLAHNTPAHATIQFAGGAIALLPHCVAPVPTVCSAVRLSLSQRQMESAGRDSKQIRNIYRGGRKGERLGERHSGTVRAGLSRSDDVSFANLSSPFFPLFTLRVSE